MLKHSVAQAVVFEHAQVLLGHIEGLKTALIFKFKRSLHGAILKYAEHLDDNLRVLDEAAATANVFILDVLLAHVAFVLNLHEVDFNHKSEHF